jgi:hypothetical protein
MPNPCDGAPKKIKLSWSKLKNYETCHHRSRLLSQGHKSPITDGRNFLPGNLADRCMRAYLSEGLFEPGGMEKFLEPMWAEHTGPDAEYRIKWRGNAREDKKRVVTQVLDALRVLEPILITKVAPYAYKPEYRFTSTLGIKDLEGRTAHIELFGAVDVAVYFGAGRYGLFDLKITEREQYIRSTLAQLTFYNIAFRGWTGIHPVEHAFWTPLLKQPVIPLDVTDTERWQMYSRIMSYCQGVWAGRWELTADESNCFNCPTRHACPRFVTPIQKDQQGRNRVGFSRADFDLMEVAE